MCMVTRAVIGFRASYHHVKLNAANRRNTLQKNIHIRYIATSDYN